MYANSRILIWARGKFSSEGSKTVIGSEKDAIGFPPGNKHKKDSFVDYGDKLHLSPLFLENSRSYTEDCKIELVDNETWQVSSSLADVWKGNGEVGFEGMTLIGDEEEDNCDGKVDYEVADEQDRDFDVIEDMRVRGNLFYKLDKHSKEYEEYKFEFHRRNSSKNMNDQKEDTKKKAKQSASASRNEKDTKCKEKQKEIKREKSNNNSSGLAMEKLNSFQGFGKNEFLIPGLQMGGDVDGKKLRVPTFNQLTAPYHEPFCLDIYVSKGSVRASIIHRATSKVVAVAHSISKDMKFDLGSTKNRSTCVAVGKVLAQRALADDIHNVVYTPRKDEVLQGKLQLVLQSIIDHGVVVKVKLKQRKVKKGGHFQQKHESNVH